MYLTQNSIVRWTVELSSESR